MLLAVHCINPKYSHFQLLLSWQQPYFSRYNDNATRSCPDQLSLHRASLLVQEAGSQSEKPVPAILVVTSKMLLHRALLQREVTAMFRFEKQPCVPVTVSCQ